MTRLCLYDLDRLSTVDFDVASISNAIHRIHPHHNLDVVPNVSREHKTLAFQVEIRSRLVLVGWR